MSDYLLLNQGGHLLLNQGGALLLNGAAGSGFIPRDSSTNVVLQAVPQATVAVPGVASAVITVPAIPEGTIH